jgi:hypothetical protein
MMTKGTILYLQAKQTEIASSHMDNKKNQNNLILSSSWRRRSTGQGHAASNGRIQMRHARTPIVARGRYI